MAPQARTSSSAPPKMVLCVSLKSSGSTWLFNAVMQILEQALRGHASGRANRNDVMGFYADNFGMIPTGAENFRYMVVKCHIPSSALLLLARALRARTIITVREPRDAIASLMQRFGHPFDGSVADIAEHAAQIVRLADNDDALILRYEDRFYESPETIQKLAAFLKVRISASARARIFRSLSRDAVQKKISKLQARGTFGETPEPDRFDPKTHWHPGHVGDGQIGKFATVMTDAQQKAVLAATASYCKTFGYAKPPRRPSRKAVAARKRP